jgi:hypothetical protein
MLTISLSAADRAPLFADRSKRSSRRVPCRPTRLWTALPMSAGINQSRLSARSRRSAAAGSGNSTRQSTMARRRVVTSAPSQRVMSRRSISPAGYTRQHMVPIVRPPGRGIRKDIQARAAEANEYSSGNGEGGGPIHNPRR